MSNDFLRFAQNGTVEEGDILSLSDYNIDPDRLKGHQEGTARRNLENTVLRQVSLVCRVVMQVVSDKLGIDVRDTMSEAELTDYIRQAYYVDPPYATTSNNGVVQLATQSEVTQGTTNKVVTASTIKGYTSVTTKSNSAKLDALTPRVTSVEGTASSALTRANNSLSKIDGGIVNAPVAIKTNGIDALLIADYDNEITEYDKLQSSPHLVLFPTTTTDTSVNRGWIRYNRGIDQLLDVYMELACYNQRTNKISTIRIGDSGISIGGGGWLNLYTMKNDIESKLSSSGGTLSGNLDITNNLDVAGNLFIGPSSINVEDKLNTYDVSLQDLSNGLNNVEDTVSDIQQELLTTLKTTGGITTGTISGGGEVDSFVATKLDNNYSKLIAFIGDYGNDVTYKLAIRANHVGTSSDLPFFEIFNGKQPFESYLKIHPTEGFFLNNKRYDLLDMEFKANNALLVSGGTIYGNLNVSQNLFSDTLTVEDSSSINKIYIFPGELGLVEGESSSVFKFQRVTGNDSSVLELYINGVRSFIFHRDGKMSFGSAGTYIPAPKPGNVSGLGQVIKWNGGYVLPGVSSTVWMCFSTDYDSCGLQFGGTSVDGIGTAWKID